MKSDIYTASLISLKNIRGRYKLKLFITDLNSTITIDIHDSLYETLGVSVLSSDNLRKIFSVLPKLVKVMSIDNNWKILNEENILSYALANISLNE